MADAGRGTVEASGGEASDSDVRLGNQGRAEALEQPRQSEERYRVPDAEWDEIERQLQSVELLGDEPWSRRILVGVDESHGSIYALQFVLSSIATRHDTIILVHVYPHVETLYPFRGAPILMLSEAEQVHKLRSEQLLKRLAAQVEKLQVAVKTESVTGDARAVLEHVARTVQPDFLVVGSHGYGPVKRTLLGSVSDYAAHHVDCPVLIVKRPPSQQSSAAESVIPGLDELSRLTAQAHA